MSLAPDMLPYWYLELKKWRFVSGRPAEGTPLSDVQACENWASVGFSFSSLVAGGGQVGPGGQAREGCTGRESNDGDDPLFRIRSIGDCLISGPIRIAFGASNPRMAALRGTPTPPAGKMCPAHRVACRKSWTKSLW